MLSFHIRMKTDIDGGIVFSNRKQPNKQLRRKTIKTHLEENTTSARKDHTSTHTQVKRFTPSILRLNVSR